MSNYRIIGPVTLMSGGSMTGTNTISSTALNVSSNMNASFQASWTGTPTGTLFVEASLDGSTYYNINAGIDTNPAGSASSVLIPIVDLPVKYLRLSYTNASGTGSLTVLGMAKSR